MENSINLSEKILLILSCLLIIPSNIFNCLFYFQHNNFILLSSVVIDFFVSITLISYTFLRLSTKEEYNWLIYITGLFVSINCFTFIYLYQNNILLILMIIRTSLIILIISYNFLITIYKKIYVIIKEMWNSYTDYHQIL